MLLQKFPEQNFCTKAKVFEIRILAKSIFTMKIAKIERLFCAERDALSFIMLRCRKKFLTTNCCRMRVIEFHIFRRLAEMRQPATRRFKLHSDRKTDRGEKTRCDAA